LYCSLVACQHRTVCHSEYGNFVFKLQISLSSYNWLHFVLRLFPTSNAIVERCFSTMLQVKTDWKNKLGTKWLEHLLRIKCAAPECVSNEFQRLLASSVDRYFRRKCRRPNSRPYGQRTKKVKVAVGEFDGVAAVAADSDSSPSPLTLQKVMLTLTLT